MKAVRMGTGSEYIRIHEEFDIEERLLKSSKRLSTDACISIFEWWQGQCEHGIPQWGRFDILDHVNWAPNITVTRRLDNDSFQFTLQGEQVLVLFPRQRWGKALLTRNHPGQYEAGLFRYYEKLCEDRHPRTCRGRLQIIDRAHIEFESIDLPFCGEDGSVNCLLSVISRIDGKPLK